MRRIAELISAQMSVSGVEGQHVCLKSRRIRFDPVGTHQLCGALHSLLLFAQVLNRSLVLVIPGDAFFAIVVVGIFKFFTDLFLRNLLNHLKSPGLGC